MRIARAHFLGRDDEMSPEHGRLIACAMSLQWFLFNFFRVTVVTIGGGLG